MNENKFGVYSFIAYVLPGSIALFSIILVAYHFKQIKLDLFKDQQVVMGLLYLSLAYMIGQITASLSHKLSRRMHWKKTQNPYEEWPYFFVNYNERSLQESLIFKANQVLNNKVFTNDATTHVNLFDEENKGKLVSPEIQRTIRFIMETELLMVSPAYKRLLNGRSFTGNAAFSTLLFSVSVAFYSFSIAIFTFILSALLLLRQRDYDRRCWREVFSALIVYQIK